MGLEDSLNDVDARRTISFPEQLELGSMKSLLEYLSRQGKFLVGYDVETSFEIGSIEYPTNEPPYFNSEARDERAKNLKGRLTDTENQAQDHFETELGYIDREESDITIFSGMKFNLVPGWGIKDYRKEVVDLWDKTRELVNSYFQQR
ncbi:hypothetical protein J4216_05835 [Candidatus Woesearchaeota archaeon]|nr:hypothetical protein [Candidatus Woesearchaeota archaeon]